MPFIHRITPRNHLSLAMEGVRSFLNSSSIHGFGHISTTRGLSRLFWILVVFSGFTFSGFLINMSFQSWAQQPIVTTIETLRAEEMKLPKVTVCPPKNIFTDLNYDLMLAQNMSFTPEMLEELKDYVRYAIDIGYLKYLNKLEDKDRFHNWYIGVTKMNLPLIKKEKATAPHPMIDYTHESYALSGNISSEFYGERFSLNKLERNVDYQVQIHIPPDLQNKKNITLILTLEWARPKNGKSKVMISKCNSGIYTGRYTSGSLLQDDTECHVNTRDSPIRVTYYHKIKAGEIQINYMPGFKLRWYYSGIILPITEEQTLFGSGSLANSYKRRVSKLVGQPR